MRSQREVVLVGDFETTVYDGQEFTEVWASAIVEVNTEDVKLFGSIDETWDYLTSLNRNIIIYYHNLKFDGAFWLSFFINTLHLQQACIRPDEGMAVAHWLDRKEMKSGTFKYLISTQGQWYSILVKNKRQYIEFRDSYKLLPFSVKQLGKGFGTKHKKLTMKYEGLRYANCPISEKEAEYIKNDVLVVKEALEIMFSNGNRKLTIGSCCLNEFKNFFLDEKQYNHMFPNLYELPLDKETYGRDNVGDYIRASYKGGWCYLVQEKANKVFSNGTTADVNSLYPSMMHSESGNYYPVGEPTFWRGNYIPEEAKQRDKFYFVRIRTRFKIKRGYLPFIQVKDNHLYKANVCLTTSDIQSRERGPMYGKYYSEYIDFDGVVKKATLTLTLTQTDWILINEHYTLIDCEILDGCYFRAYKGLFDDYIDKYKKIKQESKGAVRQIAKLFLNNLYGKMATSTDSSFKLAYTKEDDSIGFYSIMENDKKPGYIPIGSAITSYARNFTIRAAQKNYHGKNKPGFIYADTDSIHCDLPPDKLIGITVHETNFCCWKLESQWDEGIFVRQKAYIEHVTGENEKPIDNPYYNVRCAGMPEKPKLLFLASIGDESANKKLHSIDYELNKSDEEFLKTKRTLRDFKIGMTVPGKLVPVTIKGGVVLKETEYTMREVFR